MKAFEKSNFIHDINSVALVETSRIKLLSEDVYEPIVIEGLPIIPIYIKIINNGDIYELKYKLVVPSINISSTYIEKYQIDHEPSFEAISNYYFGEPIVYDNENIKTIDKLPSSYESTLNYITSHRRKIFEFANIVNSTMSSEKEKVLKKVPK